MLLGELGVERIYYRISGYVFNRASEWGLGMARFGGGGGG